MAFFKSCALNDRPAKVSAESRIEYKIAKTMRTKQAKELFDVIEKHTPDEEQRGPLRMAETFEKVADACLDHISTSAAEFPDE